MRFSNIKDLLKNFDKESEEFKFYRNLNDLLLSIECEKNKKNGMACINILEMAEIEFINGETLGKHPVIGSIEEIAQVISIVFKEVNNDPIWWKSNYPEYLANFAINTEIEFKLKNSPLVKIWE